MNIIRLRVSKAPAATRAGISPLLLFIGVLTCGACGWLGLQVAGPIEHAGRLRGENDALERLLRRADIRNQDAQKQAEAMGTDRGAKDAARSKGYVFANERPLHIQNDSRK